MSRGEIAEAAFGLAFGYVGLVAVDLFLAWRGKRLKAWVRSW